MCKFHLVGSCMRGVECAFAHNTREMQDLPDLHKTKICATLQKFGLCERPDCLYAHCASELRILPMKESTGDWPPQHGDDVFLANVDDISSLSTSTPPAMMPLGDPVKIAFSSSDIGHAMSPSHGQRTNEALAHFAALQLASAHVAALQLESTTAVTPTRESIATYTKATRWFEGMVADSPHGVEWPLGLGLGLYEGGEAWGEMWGASDTWASTFGDATQWYAQDWTGLAEQEVNSAQAVQAFVGA